MKYKGWFLGGAALGAAVPLGMRVYERVLMIGDVRPVVEWLFCPTFLFMSFRESYTATSEVILLSLVLLTNALLYGVLASVLRRASICIAALFLIGAWFLLPPSERALVKRFGEHRAELERLVQMANSDAQLLQIGPRLVVTDDGREYGASEAQSVLSPTRWAEYRTLFGAVGLNGGLERDPASGDVFLSVHTTKGKFDPVGTNLGYFYCAAFKGPAPHAAPCEAGRDSATRGFLRWKKLDSEWYIYEVYAGGIE